MTFEEAKKVFLSRGCIPVENGNIFDANKWRESVQVISSWLTQELCGDCYLLIDVTKDEILGIYDSEEKAKEDIKKLPKFTLVNISKPIKLNTLLYEDKED